MKTLKQVIENGEQLTNHEIGMLSNLLCKRCKMSTVGKFWDSLNNVRLLQSFGIYERLRIHSNHVDYVAGQNYPEEIAFVRNLIINNR